MADVYYVSRCYPSPRSGLEPTTRLSVQSTPRAPIQTVLTLAGTGQRQDREIATALLELATGERPDARTVTRFLEDRPGASLLRVTPADLEAFLGQRELDLTLGGSHA